MIHSPLERVSENLGKLEIVDPPALASRLFSFQLISRMLVISRKRNTSARYSGKGEAMRSSGRARAVRG